MLFVVTAHPQESPDLTSMSLEELLTVNVVTATNINEKLSDAPATVIVLTQKDLHTRGYTNISEFLDDLPGIDVVRTGGDYYLQTYWRGYRTTYSSPFLFLVDGRVNNSLYFNHAVNLVTYPISNIERIEIVYGPASSVYGGNASMGVINFILKKDMDEDGSKLQATMATGTNQQRLADISYFYKHDIFRLNIAGRFEVSNRDISNANMYEWTKTQYYHDTALWGKMRSNTAFADEGYLPDRKYNIGLNVFYGETELGINYNTLNETYGFTYPADKTAASSWKLYDLSAHFSHHFTLKENITSGTSVTWRKNGSDNTSNEIAGYELPDGSRIIYMDYYLSTNYAVTFDQNFLLQLPANVTMNTGFTYTQKNLQKAYINPTGPAVPPWNFDPATYHFPAVPDEDSDPANRITLEEEAVYIQAKYKLPEVPFITNNYINIGGRIDHNSIYGTNSTLRAGYVGTLDKLSVKFLYGEAFQEPTPRNVFGNYMAAGHNENLKSEFSKTLELTATYTNNDFSAGLDGYKVNVKNAFINFEGGAFNAGERNIYGFDASLHYQYFLLSVLRISCQGYYSYTYGTEKKYCLSDGVAIETGIGPIGDLARHKFTLNSTVSWGAYTLNIRGRIISSRETVDTNPLGEIPGYSVWDASFQCSDFLTSGVGLSIRCTNIFNTVYAQPGVGSANAGNTPGYRDANYHWHGSLGWFSSELPQPGRLIIAGITIEY
ncbi:MAG: TonB-dependent receptor [Ignavibacteria bacterium]|nr:TonB-dependent receptor [Ignavibacteria bacterium]